MTTSNELSCGGRTTIAAFLVIAAFAGCGGPDFAIAPPPASDDAAATDDVDNTPIIICSPCTDPTPATGDASGDATVEAERSAHEGGAGDAQADSRAEAEGGVSDATPDALADAGIDASPTCPAMMPVSCSGGCVDTSIDPNNCGGCNAPCTIDQACVGGSCVCNTVSCPSGCCSGGHCVTAETTAACGTGGVACAPCAPGIACTSGICLGCGVPTLISEETAQVPSPSQGDGFGASVALGNGTMLVGAPNYNDAGAVLSFSGAGTTWAWQGGVASNSSSSVGSSYGLKVALSGDTAMIGATPSGALADYVFTKQGSGWFPATSIAPSPDSSNGFIFNSGFAFDGNTVVFGRITSALVYSGAGNAWDLETMLQPSDYTPSIPSSQYFGAPVAISGGTILVGAAPLDTNGQAAHWGYVFVRSGSGWAQQAKLIPDGLADSSNPRFDFSVALSGDTAVLATSFGAYVFVRSGSTWTQTQFLAAPLNEAWYATSVTLDAGRMAVAAENFSEEPGAVYFYGRSNGTWTLGQTLTTGVTDDDFGAALSFGGTTLAVGATGAVYAYSCSP